MSVAPSLSRPAATTRLRTGQLVALAGGGLLACVSGLVPVLVTLAL